MTSAAELADALEAEARDIVLTAHIDLRSLQLQRSQDNIFIVKGGTRTLRVRFFPFPGFSAFHTGRPEFLQRLGAAHKGARTETKCPVNCKACL